MASKPILCIDTHELAWAAGFFDGEGSVFYRGRQRKELTLTVAQSDRRPLDRFRGALGIGMVRGPYRPRYPNGQPYFVYNVNSHVPVQAVVAMLWRWLSEPKREQAMTALSEALPYLRTRWIFKGEAKGRSLLSMEQAAALRKEYDALHAGRERIPRGMREVLMTKYGLRSVHTVATIVAGRGYVRKEVADGSSDPLH